MFLEIYKEKFEAWPQETSTRAISSVKQFSLPSDNEKGLTDPNAKSSL